MSEKKLGEGLRLFKDTIHGLQAISRSKTGAWQLIRNACHEEGIEVPTFDKIVEQLTDKTNTMKEDNAIESAINHVKKDLREEIINILYESDGRGKGADDVTEFVYNRFISPATEAGKPPKPSVNHIPEDGISRKRIRQIIDNEVDEDRVDKLLVLFQTALASRDERIKSLEADAKRLSDAFKAQYDRLNEREKYIEKMGGDMNRYDAQVRAQAKSLKFEHDENVRLTATIQEQAATIATLTAENTRLKEIANEQYNQRKEMEGENERLKRLIESAHLVGYAERAKKYPLSLNKAWQQFKTENNL